MSIQPLWLTHFIEILLVLEFQLTRAYFGTFSYKAHFRPQISSNEEAQQLRTKELHITDLLQPFQEQITELVDAVEQKVKEFTTVREQADQTEDSHINQTLLDSARERAEVMKNEVTELRGKL